MSSIDPKDVVFIAAALAKGANIWSNDKHFKKQKLVRIFTSKELSEYPKQ